MNYMDIVEDMERQHPDFFKEYEILAQQYYHNLGYYDLYAIPKSHLLALLTLFNESGYRITKIHKTDENVVYLNNNVLSFKKESK